jgi:hypothetical protein
MSVAIGIFIGCFWVLVTCLPFRRSKTKNHVVRLVPLSKPPRAVIEAGGQVIEFNLKKRGDT